MANYYVKMRGIFFLVVVLVTLTACSSAVTKKDTLEPYGTGSANTYSIAQGNGGYSDDAYDMDEGATAEASLNSGTDTVNLTEGRKLIRDISMTLETKDLDGFIKQLKTDVTAQGGYIEISEIRGVSNDEGSEQRKSSWLTVRIPSEKLDAFIESVGENANTTYINESLRDVTLEYVDVEGRIETLKQELAKLDDLMAKAEQIEDIITIEDRISEVRYEMESYQSRMNVLNQMIDYSTVTIDVTEVQAYSNNNNVWKRISEGFGNSVRNLIWTIQEFLIGIVINLPFILVIGCVIYGIVRLIRKIKKKKKK